MATKQNMTLERASELVSALREACAPPDTKATDLFCFFVDTLGMWGDTITQFAEMCGFGVAVNVRRVNNHNTGPARLYELTEPTSEPSGDTFGNSCEGEQHDRG